MQHLKVLDLFDKKPYLNQRQLFKLSKLDNFADQLKYVSSKVGTKVPELQKVNEESREAFESFKRGLLNMGIQKLLNHDFYVSHGTKAEGHKLIKKGDAVGIELECYLPKNKREYINRRFALSKLKEFVVISTDSSLGALCPDDFEGREIRVVDNINELKILKKVCKILDDVGAQVSVKCGTHVHFDMRDVTREQAEAKGRVLEKATYGLRDMLPEERRNNHNCSGAFGGRGNFVNFTSAYSSHTTIEVRAHSGTVDYTKISNWIKICKTIFEGEKSATNLETITDVISKYFSDKPELAMYMIERTNAFNDKKVELPQNIAV